MYITCIDVHTLYIVYACKSPVIFVISHAQLKLDQLHEHFWQNRSQVDLSSTPAALRVIHGQVWCCMRDKGIRIYNQDLKHERTIQSFDASWIHDVTEMRTGDLVIAANNGLYHTNSSGNVLGEDLTAIRSFEQMRF